MMPCHLTIIQQVFHLFEITLLLACPVSHSGCCCHAVPPANRERACSSLKTIQTLASARLGHSSSLDVSSCLFIDLNCILTPLNIPMVDDPALESLASLLPVICLQPVILDMTSAAIEGLWSLFPLSLVIHIFLEPLFLHFVSLWVSVLRAFPYGFNAAARCLESLRLELLQRPRQLLVQYAQPRCASSPLDLAQLKLRVFVLLGSWILRKRPCNVFFLSGAETSVNIAVIPSWFCQSKNCWLRS